MRKRFDIYDAALIALIGIAMFGIAGVVATLIRANIL